MLLSLSFQRLCQKCIPMRRSPLEITLQMKLQWAADKDNFGCFRSCWVYNCKSSINSILQSDNFTGIGGNSCFVKMFQNDFATRDGVWKQLSQSYVENNSRIILKVFFTRKKSYTTSMPSTEACFLQWAHPGETEKISCGGKKIFIRSMKYSYLFSFFRDKEADVDPKTRCFFLTFLVLSSFLGFLCALCFLPPFPFFFFVLFCPLDFFILLGVQGGKFNPWIWFNASWNKGLMD